MKTPLLRLLQRTRLLGPAFRTYESLQARRAPRAEAPADGLPVPPAQLRVRVAGTADERSRFESGGLVVRWESVAGTNLCSAFHPEAYARGPLAVGFDVVAFEREGARGNPHQDLVLLRKSR